MIEIRTTPKPKRNKKRKPDLFPWILAGVPLVAIAAVISWLLLNNKEGANNSKDNNQAPLVSKGNSEKPSQNPLTDAEAIEATQPSLKMSNISGLEIISMRMKLADYHKTDIEKRIPSSKGRLHAHKTWMSYQATNKTFSDERVIDEFKIRFPEDYKVMILD